MPIRYAMALLALAAVYFLAGRLGLSMATAHPSVTPIWPPTGLSIAALALFGRRLWPAVWVGAFLTNLYTTGDPLPCIGIATGNAAEAMLGARFLRKLGGRRAFDTPRAFLAFIATSGLLAPLVGAVVGVASLYAGGSAPLRMLPLLGITWWFGDALSVWVLVPFLIQAHAAFPPRLRALRPARLLEAAVLSAYLVAACLLIFGGLLPAPYNRLSLSFMTLPPLLWAAFRFGRLGVSSALLTLSVITLWGTARGYGQFATQETRWSFLILQMFLANGVIAFQILAQVVWARDRAVQDLRESKRTIDGIVRSVPGIIWESRGEPGKPGFRFNFVNAYAETLLGYSASEWVSDPGFWLTMVHPEDRDRLVAEAAQTFRGERGGPTQVRLVAKDGHPLDVEIRAVRLLDEAGRPMGMRGFVMDVTDRRRAEERLRKVEEQLGQARKMEAVGRLAGGVAHDFNNLLTAVNGYSDLLLDSLEKGSRPWLHAQEIHTAGERAAALTRKLLSFSRKEIVQPRILDMNALVRDLEGPLRGILGEGLQPRPLAGSGAAAGEGGSGSGGPRDPRSRPQCARGDGPRRRPHRGHRIRANRRGRDGIPPEAGAGTLCAPAPDGHGARHGGRHPPASLRTLFHHQGQIAGHRPGASHRLRHHGEAGRRHPGRKRARPGFRPDPVFSGHRRQAGRRRSKADTRGQIGITVHHHIRGRAQQFLAAVGGGDPRDRAAGRLSGRDAVLGVLDHQAGRRQAARAAPRP